MKPRIEGDFCAALDDDFAWRHKEVIDITNEAKRAAGSWRESLVRAGIALTYAHWEGFIKRAAQLYLDYIGLQRHHYRDLALSFWLVGLRRQIGDLYNGSHAQRKRALEDILACAGHQARIIGKGAIDTESNLSSTVFDKIARSCGVETLPYEPYYPLIDKALVERRNHVAHGDRLPIDITRFQELSAEVLGLMRRFNNDLQNSVVSRSYLKR